MTLVKSDIPNLLTPGLRANVFAGFESYVGNWRAITTVLQSNGDEEKYAWVGGLPKMREWQDERLPKSFGEYTYSIPNKRYEASLAIDRLAIDDDRYGLIAMRARALGEEAARFQDELVFTTLTSGFTNLCYDGKPFFATNHEEGESGVQSNMTTAEFSSSALQDAITAMSFFKDDRGKIVGSRADTLVVGPQLQWIAREILESPVVVVKVGEGTTNGGATAATNYNNIMQGILRLIVSPYITDRSWYVLRTDGIIRPIIYQERDPLEFDTLERGDSERAFMREEYLYGIRLRCGVGYGLWQYAYGSTGTG